MIQFKIQTNKQLLILTRRSKHAATETSTISKVFFGI